ncbi:MAG: multidrug efflux SMR transporter [Liquorilactobacillus hordei]|uniref:QacE family quaternary ammonium compound efflux SMR transporter n=1 Tax=Liquorilactobacillus hordei TaxID=468911 RepID=A0A3S6QP95_9LACO|nr:multidrug efflux SMR transporter [Liquorilactobacillus hordei]AUJ29738.1 QacE family quaternary ammonium compound efflux SMR transporter [Liquorilactobacillus hordei]MBZ2404994.1 QacE family quaternary ammonium compound efflux SMR transporter [Liquorilactobacillus hordei]
MTWIYLIIAGLFEVVWATSMKLSHGFTNIFWDVVTLLGMLFSFYFLAIAIKHLPISIAYPVWTGIGAVGSILAGVILFRDQISVITWIFIFMLLVGIIGIKVTSGH